ncbi:MAG: molybdopterin molybdotransferase MoeA [Taibaiella sp.]|nr:molybdopterin molybdotransferase MoeA [Taibaiella sp.]
MALISVEEAQEKILGEARSYGNELVPIANAVGRVLSSDVFADRDLPPYDRVTMDGIAIRYDDVVSGINTFSIQATMAAGDAPVAMEKAGGCVEIMTGCALPEGVDTVVRYEDVSVLNGAATIHVLPSRRGANIHARASDKQKGDLVLRKGLQIGAAHISMLASVGLSSVPVTRFPRIAVISTGDELVDVADNPLPHQVRRSNSVVLASILQNMGADVTMKHLPDELAVVSEEMEALMMACDVLLLSGGVSMGKFDVIPAALHALGFVEVFHKVKQRPGKPFWFGTHPSHRTVVFAFPGNPVSTFLCTYRYFLSWLHMVSGGGKAEPIFAVLAEDVIFTPDLQYFLPVRLLSSSDGRLIALPAAGNGSGDFSVLVETDAFIELPAGKSEFKSGEAYRVWPFNKNVIGI